jgi:hypothetical protein
MRSEDITQHSGGAKKCGRCGHYTRDHGYRERKVRGKIVVKAMACEMPGCECAEYVRYSAHI